MLEKSFFETDLFEPDLAELNLAEVFQYKYQTMLNMKMGDQPKLAEMEAELRSTNAVFGISNIYRELQENRQFRVISHNDKLDRIKEVAKKVGADFRLESITKCLHSSTLTHSHLGRLRLQFQEHCPQSEFQLINYVQGQPNKNCFLVFNNFQEAMLAKLSLSRIGVNAYFKKNA